MSFKPLHEKVHIEIIEEPDMRPSGVIIPEDAKYRSKLALVKAVGKKVPSDIKPDMQVIFDTYLTKHDYLNFDETKKEAIISYVDILAVVEGENVN